MNKFNPLFLGEGEEIFIKIFQGVDANFYIKP